MRYAAVAGSLIFWECPEAPLCMGSVRVARQVFGRIYGQLPRWLIQVDQDKEKVS